MAVDNPGFPNRDLVVPRHELKHSLISKIPLSFLSDLDIEMIIRLLRKGLLARTCYDSNLDIHA